MKLAISNLAWKDTLEREILGCLSEYNFTGLEIAPSKVFGVNPYSRICDASKYACELRSQYGVTIPSIQSIWFGRGESLFGDVSEREFLLAYTKKAIDFASAIGAGNIVFGCPKNRNVRNENDYALGVDFFRELGSYATGNNTVIAIEANPVIYSTNFLTTTSDAIAFIKDVGNDGIKLNLDIGTMIQNNESVSDIAGFVTYVNHVHISEPYLKVIEHRQIHDGLLSVLRLGGYDKFVSIEMGEQSDSRVVIDVMKYVSRMAV